VQELLQDPGVPPEAGDGDLLPLAGRHEARLLLVLGPAEDEEAALVEEPVAAERRGVGECLFLFDADRSALFAVLCLVFVFKTPPPARTVSRNDPAGSSGLEEHSHRRLHRGTIELSSDLQVPGPLPTVSAI
jgi:hypothetical protein